LASGPADDDDDGDYADCASAPGLKGLLHYVTLPQSASGVSERGDTCHEQGAHGHNGTH
jgi:hypothetical protein